MKKFILAALVLCTTVVNAAEITVMEAPLSIMSSFRTMVGASFQMNKTTGEGFVRATVTEERMIGGGYYDHSGHWFPNNFPTMVRVFDETVKLDGLMLMGDKVIYHGADGDVDCGTMGVSRIFKKPTIYLNGNCQLSGFVSGNRRDTKVVVKLNTK